MKRIMLWEALKEEKQGKFGADTPKNVEDVTPKRLTASIGLHRKNTEHQYTIDALAQSKHSDNKVTLTKLTLIDSLICQDLPRFGEI